MTKTNKAANIFFNILIFVTFSKNVQSLQKFRY